MYCKFCQKALEPASTRINRISAKQYCNNECQHGFQSAVRKADFLAGRYVGKLLKFQTGFWTRNILIEAKTYKCCKCGICEYNNEPITLEVNHIDGDAENNILDNLEFLCPNCHSQTSNFRALNKNSKRTYRKKYNKIPD